MTEGVVAAWHKKVGDEVESGELLAEIETDKATMDFESFQDGILLHIGVETGATAPVDSILCVLGEKGEDIKRILADAEKDVVITDTASVPAPSAAPVPVAIAAPVAVSAPAAPVPVTHAAPAPLATNARVIASPLAKKLADKLGLSLDRIPGSGAVSYTHLTLPTN